MRMNFVSHFGANLENVIWLKVSLGGAESTYPDRAQNFDCFCSEKYPDVDCLTEPLALSWIKDAGIATGVILSKLHVLLAEPDAATRLGLRGRVMLVFFYDTGARIQKVLNVRICDLKLDSTSKVVLHGKGNKVRAIPLMKDTVQHLKHYISVFHEGESAESPQFFFYTERKSVRNPFYDYTVRLMI